MTDDTPLDEATPEEISSIMFQLRDLRERLEEAQMEVERVPLLAPVPVRAVVDEVVETPVFLTVAGPLTVTAGGIQYSVEITVKR